jgi:hypothetical protein
MDSMMRALGAGLAIMTAFAAPSVAWSADVDGLRDFAVLSSDVVQQRKDVDEGLRPLPPSGPATPLPYCSPGSPICP